MEDLLPQNLVDSTIVLLDKVEEEIQNNLILLFYYNSFYAQQQSSDVNRWMTKEKFNWSKSKKSESDNIGG